MNRVILLSIFSIIFSALAIYADCNLPTGGACSIEDLKRQKAEFDKIMSEYDYLDKLNEKSEIEQEKEILNKEFSKESELVK